MSMTPEEQSEIEARFQNFDARSATVYTPGVDALSPDLLLVRAQAARDYHLREADSVMRAAVAAARAEGLSWHKIGVRLGTTGEAARQRYTAA